jgi:hypothetical protein
VTTTSGSVRFPARIGDGQYGSRDVDLYKVVLRAGQSLVIDVNARTLPVSSPLDSFVRFFDGSGRELARNDDDGSSFDSYLSLISRSGGTFYVGISGYGNSSYSTARAGSGRSGSTGAYELAFNFGALAQRTPTRHGAAMRMMGAPDFTTTALPAATACQPTDAAAQRPAVKRWTIVWR